MMKLNALHISDVLEQDGLVNDFSFYQILQRFMFEKRMISHGKRSKKSKGTVNKFFYLAAM
jgi:hypothetical protein